MYSVLWNIKWILALCFVLKEIPLGVAIDVEENREVTIQCPLSGNIQYPTWTGPDGIAHPLTDGQTIKEPGIEWVNNKDLNITKALLKHDGNYTCKDANENTGTVELDVQYFRAWAEFTEASPANIWTVLTCTVWSNPRSKIHSHVFVPVIDGKTYRNSTTTFDACVPDPLEQNRTMCRVRADLPVSKRENGLKMSCAFEYRNKTIKLFPKVKFLFPPAFVNIIVNRTKTDSDKRKVTLTCSTNSSNPVSSLIWRKGKKYMASENVEIESSYRSIVMDAEYNGINITQNIDIEVAKLMNKEKVFCCARHLITEYCDSINLDYLVASAGCVVAKWITAWLLICTVFVTQFE